MRTTSARVRFLRFAKTQPLGAVGLILVLLLVALAVVGPWITPKDPNALGVDVLVGPGSEYPFGTDNFGRDYLSRTIAGARASVSIAVAAIGVGVTAGILLGMASAYIGGTFDLLFQRLVDTALALPALIMAMFFVAVFGSGVTNLIIILSITIVPPVSRVARSASISVIHETYIDAARVIGVPAWRMLLRHVLPNIAGPMLVIATTGVGAVILAEAGLSFLGLGVPPPEAAWGRMLSDSRPFAISQPWLAVFPGIAISLAVLGFNLLGDAVRDAWDPRLRVG